jgi:capsid protein
MYAHGLSRRTLAGLVRAGLATMRREVAVAGDRPVEVVRIRIAAAGRKAVEE